MFKIKSGYFFKILHANNDIFVWAKKFFFVFYESQKGLFLSYSEHSFNHFSNIFRNYLSLPDRIPPVYLDYEDYDHSASFRVFRTLR